jgi:ergothioneine biosynthesis protein EgtB
MKVQEQTSDGKQVFLEQETATLADQYMGIRKYTEEICKPLMIEDYVVQPDPDVSPPKWHLAHTTWFFEEFLLVPYLKNYRRFHPQFSYLFNSYYESLGERTLRLHRGNMSRPSVEEIYRYRAYVDEHIQALLQNPDKHIIPIIEIGCNHEQQHQELLLADIKFILGHNPLFPAYKSGFAETHTHGSGDSFTHIPGGEYSIGYKGYGFSYDNEHSVHNVMLNSFRIGKRLVTNGEYLQFINDGGYQRWDYWHSDGWTWVKEQDVRSPLYWHFIDGAWHRYSLAGLEKVGLEEPVTHVSFYEASAYAMWKEMRLPTEFEWEAAADQFSWGQRWEHTSSAYLPYPGYKKPDGPIGEYNGKFMVNTMVLRGASIATPPNHSRKTYRNFFYPKLRWQFNGIRLCKDV